VRVERQHGRPIGMKLDGDFNSLLSLPA
jgi:hypothetical protein